MPLLFWVTFVIRYASPITHGADDRSYMSWLVLVHKIMISMHYPYNNLQVTILVITCLTRDEIHLIKMWFIDGNMLMCMTKYSHQWYKKQCNSLLRNYAINCYWVIYNLKDSWSTSRLIRPVTRMTIVTKNNTSMYTKNIHNKPLTYQTLTETLMLEQ